MTLLIPLKSAVALSQGAPLPLTLQSLYISSSETPVLPSLTWSEKGTAGYHAGSFQDLTGLELEMANASALTTVPLKGFRLGVYV